MNVKWRSQSNSGLYPRAKHTKIFAKLLTNQGICHGLPHHDITVNAPPHTKPATKLEAVELYIKAVIVKLGGELSGSYIHYLATCICLEP